VVLAIAGAVVAVVLAVRWRQFGFEWSEFTSTFRSVRWGWILLSAVLGLATYVGRALRWQVLMRGIKHPAGLWNLVSATTIGFTAIVLFGRAGELVRPYLIAVKEKTSFSSQVAVWLMERIYDLLTALLIFGFALSQVESSAVNVGPALEWVLNAGGMVAGIVGFVSLTVLVLFSLYAESMERRLFEALAFLPEGALAKVRPVLSAFRQGMTSGRQRSFIYLVSIYSLLEWTLIVGCYACVFRAFPETAAFSPTDVVIFVGFVAFGSVVQLPGVGGGMQVVSVIVLTELFRLSLEVASSLAVLIWAVTFVIIMPVGLLLAFHEGLTWRKLKSIEEEANL
jgi:uncharacterized protein (TIRG00374 family)